MQQGLLGRINRMDTMHLESFREEPLLLRYQNHLLTQVNSLMIVRELTPIITI